jgi:toxin ParE1/3/4
MPQITLTRRAEIDLERLRAFLPANAPRVAKNAAKTLKNAFEMIGRHPMLGRAVEFENFDCRELLVAFGSTGYIVLYRVIDAEVYILAVRHQREKSF